MLILFNANTNSFHLHLTVMKFIIFIIVSIGCHVGWLLYQPIAPFTVQFSQAQPVQQIAIQIINSQQTKPATKVKHQPKTQEKPAMSTQFHAKENRLAKTPTKKVESSSSSSIAKPKTKKSMPVKETEPAVSKVAKAQQSQNQSQAAPASSAPTITKQHSLKNQVVDLKTLPVFKAPRPPLNYPLKAKRRGYQGVAILQIELNAKGAITKLSVLQSSGFTELDKAALNNVSQWKFHPVIRDNHGIKARFSVPIEFSLRS